MPRVLPRRVPWVPLALATGLLASAAHAAPPRLRGDVVGNLSVTLEKTEGATHVPSPFTVVPGGGRCAVYVPESGGILLVEQDRILHHFPLANGFPRVDDLAASDSLLVAGWRPGRAAATVDLLIYDLHTGRVVHRLQSGNPRLLESEWRIVVEAQRVGVFDPQTAATYPLWERATGAVVGGEQIVQATSGIGFGESAHWIPNPEGSVDRKVRGQAEPWAEAGEGEFVGSVGDDVLVLAQTELDAKGQRRLPREIVVHVLEGRHAISELRLSTVSPGVEVENPVIVGPLVQVRGDRLYWLHLGVDFLEIRSAQLPRTGP